ncbi:autotransporter-associated beta strand repeat-containing protein [Novosphingobium terrae]|uniref:autotransporter-associated beta strand repeat-containing protein n=1 Tax=Novosphingobium terrae TaxID=2726189 RepID=UPI00197F1537|nr:autotransporter-associated beta strand repeat-containing protein [Novosphingobium terrae]
MGFQGNTTFNARRAWRRAALASSALVVFGSLLLAAPQQALANQLPASAFQTYDSSTAASITPGPLALYAVSVDSIAPTQASEGYAEVAKKTAGFDLLSPSQLQSTLLTDIEPVVIGPGGQLYLTDGHHTFTALENSIYGASNPTVYVNVIANYSNLTTAQFYAAMQAANLLLPLNNGTPETVDATGAPLPTALTALTNDPYRGLEYSILKNKSSTLFPTTANITGAVGANTPGLDKMTGLYSDFFEAAAYRNANGGLGLPTLSPGDIALATQWNLNPNSVTTLPNVSGTVTAAQLPGFILNKNITNAGGITNATLAGGALDGNGTFTGLTSVNLGTLASPIIVGTPNTGFIMQLGADKGFSVTLNGTNSYTGGTSLLAGTLAVASDAALGAAPTGAAIDTSNLLTSIQAANGIIFNSLAEGNATLTLGTTTGGTFATARPIAVGGEAATLNVNGNTVTLGGALYSLGTKGVGIGTATGFSDLTIDDLSSASNGKLILSTASPYFYGNVIIGNSGTPTVTVMNDAALGNTTGNVNSIGQVDLNGGTLQAGASFAAPERNLFLGGGSNIDVNGFATSWGSLTNVQRTLDILNSSTTAAGSITFDRLIVGAAATLQLAGGTKGETVTLTNGITRTAQDTLIIQPTSSSSLGTTTEKLLSGTGASSLVNGIAPVWIVTNNGVSKSAGPYDFVTYGANGYVKATYSATTLTGSTGASVVNLSAAGTLTANTSAYALNTNGKAVTLGSNTLTLGNGTNPAGLILASGSSLSGGTLAFGSSEGVIWLSGSNPTISSTITGSNGLTFSGSGAVALSTAANVSGLVTIDAGTVTLSGTNIFSSVTAGILLDDTKSKPAAATLAITANNMLTTLNTVGSNSAINLSGGAVLTLGDTTNNLGSTISATLKESGAATAGALTLNGSGLVDFTGASKNSLNLVSGSSIILNNSAALRVAANDFANANFGVVLNGTSQLQFAQNAGGIFANTVSGTGVLHLIGGTLQITGTANSYTGGTIVETGSTLDITTANLPALNPNVTAAGGTVLFDQTTSGTYAGVISDGAQMGVGSVLSGMLIKDDSTGNNSGNVTLSQAQAFTGATYIEAGTLTLGAVNTLASSSSVDLGRVGGGATATLALNAANTIKGLSSEASNTTAVTLGGNALTIATTAGTSTSFGGTISDGSSIGGSLTVSGAGTQTLTGANSYTGGTTLTGGTLVLAGSGTLGATTGTLTVSGGTLDLGGTTQTTGAATLSSGTVQNGALNAASYTTQGGTVSAVLAGSGTLTAASGTTTLSGANSYSGGTVVNGCTLALTGTGTLGATSGTVTVNGGTLALGGTTQTTGALTLSSGTISGGEIDASSFTVSSGTISAVLGGSGALTKNDSGTVTLSGANSYTGGTTLNAGTLALSGNGTLGSSSGALTINGGTLNLGGNTLTAGLLTLNGGSIQNGTITSTAGIAATSGTISGLNGAVGLTVSTGTVAMSGINTYTGGTTVTSGTLALSSGTVMGNPASALAVAGGTLDLGTTIQTVGSLNLTGGTIQNGSLQALTFNVQSGTISAALIGTGTLTKTGAGTVTLSAANDYVGGTTVAGGTLALTGAATLGGATGSGRGALTVTGGTLDLGGTSQSTGALTLSAGTIQNGTLNAASYGLTGGTVSAVLAGSGALTKTGSDTAALSGANSYTGGTTVNAGTLVLTGALASGLTNNANVNAQGSITGAILNNAGAVLTVTGALVANGAVTNAGTINDSASSFTGITALTNSGTITLGKGATLTTASLNNSGIVTIQSGATLNDDLTNSGTVSNSGTYNANVASNTGSITNTASAVWTGNITSNASGTITNAGTWTGNAANTGGTLINNGTLTGSVSNTSGSFTNSGTVTGGLSNSGTTTTTGTINGGVTNTGTITASGTITGNIVNTGTFKVAGVLTNTGGTFLSTAGLLDLTAGSTLNAATLSVTGGTLQLDSGASLGNSTVTVGANASVVTSGGAALPFITTYNNAGVLDIRNGSATNAFAMGNYNGLAGSQILAGVNVTNRTADVLSVNTASGTSQIVLSVTGTPRYDPAGITLVTSASTLGAGTFTLAGGPVRSGLFQYDLAYNGSRQFVLISTPSAEAYNLATLPSAAQAIWYDTASVVADHQGDLAKRGQDDTGVHTSAWARAVGDWSSRTQHASYADYNKAYGFDTSYNQHIYGIYGGVDAEAAGLASESDRLSFGAFGGYLNSQQSFSASPSRASFVGGSFGFDAGYRNGGLELSAVAKMDVLRLHYTAPLVTNGGGKQSAAATSYGVLADAGYRVTLGRGGFVEPVAGLAFVSSDLGQLSLAGTQVRFNGQANLRGKLGLRTRFALVDSSSYALSVQASGSYWSRLSGSASAMLDSGGGAPLLVLYDNQVKRYGEFGLGLDVQDKKSHWSGFVKGDYRVNSNYRDGSVKLGVRYAF